MNAAEQAKDFRLASKIAAIVNLFKLEFPDVRSDLKPWMNDPDTQEMVDPDSIDIGFHFPGRSRLLQSRSLLVQIRCYQDPLEGQQRAIGVEVSGFDHKGKQWWVSTIEHWQFFGNTEPVAEMKDKLKHCCRQILALLTET